MLNKKILTLLFVVAFLTLLVGCFPAKNQAPIITSDPVETATVGIDYTYDVNATDPEDDVLTYSLTTKPGGMAINSATGVISWTPILGQVGDNAVTVVVSDGDLSVVQPFTITVSKPTPTPIPTKYYTITATAGANGTIDPSGKVKVKKGSDKTFTIVPDDNYHIADVLVDGSSVGTVGTYDFTDVTKNHTIKATFAIDTYTITATAGPGGSISPSGAVGVNHGANQSFTITPTVFYSIVDVLVDGGSIGAQNSYTFSNVTQVHTIHATFLFYKPVYNQDKEKYYDTIQDAIDDAASNPGDTILVAPGTYNEYVAINKSLTLLGAQAGECAIGRTGDEAEIVGSIHVSSGVSDFTIDGFKITGNGWDCMQIASASVTIKNNIIVAVDSHPHPTNFVYLNGVSNADIECNDFSGAYKGAERPNVLNLTIGNDAGTITVANNKMHDVGGGGGIGVYQGGFNAVIEITDNVIDNTGDGIWTYNSTFDTLLITGNDILNNAGINQQSLVGGPNLGININVNVAGDVQIHDNNIEGNEYGIYNDSSNAAVNATNNWWGDASGPYHPVSNPLGTGDAVSDNVGYIPWTH